MKNELIKKAILAEKARFIAEYRDWFSGIAEVLDKIESRAAGPQAKDESEGWTPAVSISLIAPGRQAWKASLGEGSLYHPRDPVTTLLFKQPTPGQIMVRLSTRAGRREEFIFSGGSSRVTLSSEPPCPEMLESLTLAAQEAERKADTAAGEDRPYFVREG